MGSWVLVVVFVVSSLVTTAASPVRLGYGAEAEGRGLLERRIFVVASTKAQNIRRLARRIPKAVLSDSNGYGAPVRVSGVLKYRVPFSEAARDDLDQVSLNGRGLS